MPQLKLNEKNAIILNCKDGKQFQEVYEKTIQKHFAKQVQQEPVLKVAPQSKPQPEEKKKPKVLEPYPELQQKHDDQPIVENLDQDNDVPSGFVLDTKSKSSAKKNQEDEFKRQLREIEKRQEEEIK